MSHHEAHNPEAHNQTPQFTRAKQRLASNPDTTPEVLDKLAKRDESDSLMERVAENPSTAASTLANLSEHEESDVRAAVGENVNTPQDVMEKLADDESLQVRYALAENVTTSRDLLEDLSQDENPYIAERAKQTLGKVLGEIDEREIDERKV